MESYLKQNKEDMLHFLEKIVNIDSGSYNKEGIDRIGTLLKKEYEALGFRVNVIKQDNYGNHLVIQHEEAIDPQIIIMAHMDTVFQNGTAKKNPFQMDGEYAYGPGVVDMKGSLTTLLYACKILRKFDEDAYKNIQIIINSDEEIGTISSWELIEKCAINKQFALVMEAGGANHSVVTSRRGASKYVIDFMGKAAHAGSAPESGSSAIEELAHKVLQLHALTNNERGITLNVGLIKGGVSVNTIAPHATCEVDVRYSSHEQAEFLKDQIMNICTQVDVKGTQIQINEGYFRPPMVENKGGRQLLNTIIDVGKEIGINVNGIKRGGGSDASITSALGIPTVDGLGPLGGHAHSEREFMDISSLYTRTLLLAKTIQQLSAK